MFSREIYLAMGLALLSLPCFAQENGLPSLNPTQLALPGTSLRNTTIDLSPTAAAPISEVLDLMSTQQALPNAQLSIQLVDQTNPPDLQVVDEAFVRWSTGDAPELQQPMLEAMESLGSDPASLLRRGIILEHVGRDPSAAAQFYQRSAEGGDAWGELFGGRALLGAGLSNQDGSVAIDYLGSAAESEILQVQSAANQLLAKYYSEGVFTEVNLQTAEEFHLQAIEADPEAAAEYIEFLLDERDLPSGDQLVLTQVEQLAEAGNASAILLQYQNDQNAQPAEFIQELSQIGGAAADTARGDIYLDQGDLFSAFGAFNSSADVDSYALAQTGTLALNNPDIDFGISEEQALAAIQESARFGEALALLEMAKRAQSPEDRYTLSQQAKENDPTGRYRDDILTIQGTVCAVNAQHCPEVPIWYVTNRVQIGGDRTTYGNRIADVVSTGIARTVIRSTEEPNPEPNSFIEIGLCNIHPRMCRDPQLTLRVGMPNIVPSQSSVEEFVTDLKISAESADREQVIIYIHGFNNTFDVAAERLALMTDRGRLKAVPILFSWASGGEPLVYRNSEGRRRLAYTEDLKAARQSCAAFAGVLQSVVSHFGAENTHVLAHSMGAHLTEMIVFGCSDEVDRLPDGSLKSLIFAASDVDRAVFEERYDVFRQVTDHFSLYVTTNDAALKLASDVVHGKPRLGQGGPDRFLRDGTITIDSTPLELTDESGISDHAHVFDVPEVRRDVAHVLKGRFEIGDPRCLTPVEASAYYLDSGGC